VTVAVEVPAPLLLLVELVAAAEVVNRHGKGPVPVHLMYLRREIRTCLISQLLSATS